MIHYNSDCGCGVGSLAHSAIDPLKKKFGEGQLVAVVRIDEETGNPETSGGRKPIYVEGEVDQEANGLE